MIVLMTFAFLAGLVTVLSPCILPILPIVLSGALSGGRWRPLGVIIGFILSFTFFATFSFTLAKAIGLSTEVLRYISVVLLIIFGVSVFIPKVQILLERIAAGFSVSQGKHEGFWGGIILGVSLGFVWTPCVGPILASVLTLAATSQLTIELIFITMAFSVGTALPMLAIAFGGQKAIQALPALRKRSQLIQKTFGVLIVLTALLILFNLDRAFQAYILEKFPQYGEGLTKFEQNDAVQKQLDRLKGRPSDGSSLFDFQGLIERESAKTAPNPDFAGGGTWLNSEPLSLNRELAGKVVLVDFWTYTCINCIRTFPYLKAWYENYNADGFEIVGVHSPEFEFEKDTDNVQMALEKYDLTYPVVQDNDFAIWTSYENQFWPAHYLIDRAGKIRYVHFGEGEYDTTEGVIRKLLMENGSVTQEPVEVADQTPRFIRTPETYLGYGRIDRFASLEEIMKDQLHEYSVPRTLTNDQFAYLGGWTVQGETARSTKDAELHIRFTSQSVFLVMRASENPAKAEVYLDGKRVDATNAGEDVENGIVTVTEDRLYTIIKLESVGTHVLRLKFIDNPVEVYAFTFG